MRNYIPHVSMVTVNKISKLYFPKLKFGKISRAIIFLLNSNCASRDYIYNFMSSLYNIDKKYTQHFIWNLKSKGFIMENQTKLNLTIFGKFGFLMCKYDISFIQLCLLLEGFYCQTRMMERNCKDWFYVTSYFIDKVDGVFTSDYVAWNVSRLMKKRLIHRFHKGTITLTSNVIDDLIQYREIIDYFHSWFIETWRKKRQLILQDSLIIGRQHEGTIFIKNQPHEFRNISNCEQSSY